MTPDELRATPELPNKGAALDALWWAGRNDWVHAHNAAQSDDGAPAAWVHAYLHRVEGDLENAKYWYAKAGKPVATDPLDDEWRAIASALLSS
jgi:hypothetical protein